MDEALKKRLDFIIELDRMKSILRRSLRFSGDAYEDDAQHSWHAAVMAMVLKDYAAEEVDIDRVVQMILVHDLIEIYAGDTFAYDVEGNMSKAEREREAADRLYAMLPGEQGAQLRAMWEEFDGGETPDSRFALAMDRLQPLIANDLTGGHTWQDGTVSAGQVYERNSVYKDAAPQLFEYAEDVINRYKEKGILK